ncbi:MAG: peptidase [Crocinitomicaceae bacterium]|jgi:hypothetical protein|nr:peptidase [Crocinitomicaceae bacterium]
MTRSGTLPLNPTPKGEKRTFLPEGGQKEVAIIILALLVFSSFFSFSQVETGRQITQELCSEKYFGRGYIKNGDSLAAEYLASEFEKRGLKKIKGSWFQSFSFDVNTFPAEMEIKFDEKILQPGVDYLIDPASGSMHGSWRYRLLTEKEVFDEEYMKKLLYDIRGEKSWNSLVIDTRNMKGDSLKEMRSLQDALARMIHVMLITDEKFTFSVADEQLPFALVKIHGSAFEKEALLQTKITAVLKKQHNARNVLACLPAKKRTKKTLFITAHYDHLGGMGSETYFPGGNDNASGTSMLFALADEFKRGPLKFNVVFIAFAGEEAGLLGSKYYVDHPLVKEKRLHFVLNLDIMGSGEDGITVVNATEFPELFEKLNAVNEQHKLLAQVKKRGKAANSDHYWFSEKGFPAFFIYTMGPNKNYHDVFDTYEALSFNEYNDLVKLISGFLRSF